MSKEIWKPVPSKPGIMASSWGRIKLPESTAVMPNGNIRKYVTKPIFGTRTRASKNARHQFMGCYSKKFGNLKVHRLVCEAFHGPPPSEKSVVIHINEVGTDNNPDNLKWGTQKENLNMPGFIEYCKSRTGENNPSVKGLKAK